MAQISSLGALPDPVAQYAGIKAKTNATGQSTSAAKTNTSGGVDETQPSPLQAQLTRLSSVLSSLQSNISNVRGKYVEALNSVKSGTYSINPLDVSRSIVSDALADSH